MLKINIFYVRGNNLRVDLVIVSAPLVAVPDFRVVELTDAGDRRPASLPVTSRATSSGPATTTTAATTPIACACRSIAPEGSPSRSARSASSIARPASSRLRRAASPCYACVFPPTQAVEEARCATMGVFAPLVGIIGSMQAAEALKLIIGLGESPVGRLQLLDARTMRWREMRFGKDPACPVCGQAAC